MSRRKIQRICEACGQTFLAQPAHTKTCSPACQQHLKRRQAAEKGTHGERPGLTPQSETPEVWTGRTLYAVSRTPPFLVTGRPILAETERLVFTSNSLVGDWEAGARLAAAFEKSALQGLGPAGLFSDFGTVFLDQDVAQAFSVARATEEQARIAKQVRLEQERERQRERQKNRERRSSTRAQREWDTQQPAAGDPPNAFRFLGLRWPCSVDDVKAAYRKLVHKHHPDKGGSPAAFIALREAYQDALYWCKTHPGSA